MSKSALSSAGLRVHKLWFRTGKEEAEKPAEKTADNWF